MESATSLSLEDVLVSLKDYGVVRETKSRTSSFSGGVEPFTSSASVGADATRAALLQTLNFKLEAENTLESQAVLLKHLPALASVAPDASAAVLTHLTASFRGIPDSTRAREALPMLLEVATSAYNHSIVSQANLPAQHWTRLAAIALKACTAVILGEAAELARPASKRTAGSAASLRPTRDTITRSTSVAPLEPPILARLLDVALLSLSVGVVRSIKTEPALRSFSSHAGLKGGALGGFGATSHSRSASRTQAWIVGSESSPGTSGVPPISVSSQSQGLKGKSSHASLSSLTSAQSESSNWRLRTKEIASTQAWSQSEEETEGETHGSADGGVDARKLTDAQRSLRLAALALLSVLCSTHSAALLPHWNRLLLDAPSPTPPQPTSSLPSRSIPQPTQSSNPSTSLIHALETDPSVAVRTSAARVLEALLVGAETSGFLAAAQERSTRLEKYTSLSSRIAGVLVDLREKVVNLLSAYAKLDATLAGAAKGRAHALGAEALLKLAKTLVQTTWKANFRISHMALLRGPALSLCSSSEPSLAVCAYSLLGALLASPAPALAAAGQPDPSVLQDGGKEMVDALLRHLSEECKESEVRAQAWTALAALISKQWQAAEPHEAAIVDLLHSSFQSSHLAANQHALILEAAASALAALLRSRAASEASTPACYALLSPMFQVGLTTARAQLADALPAWSALFRRVRVQEGFADPVELMRTYASDAEGTVRANAARALGAMLASEAAANSVALPEGSQAAGAESTHSWALEIAVELLLDLGTVPSAQGLLQDSSPLVRMRASWALANASDALFSPTRKVHGNVWERCTCAALLASRDEERISLHALRALGSLLSSLATPADSVASKTTIEAVGALCAALELKRPSPKLSWNAAAALERALSNDVVRALMRHDLAGRSSLALATALGMKTFKTKLSAARALKCHKAALEYGEAPARAKLRAQVERACEVIKGEVREATFSEAQLHGKPCIDALFELKRHLDELGV